MKWKTGCIFLLKKVGGAVFREGAVFRYYTVILFLPSSIALGGFGGYGGSGFSLSPPKPPKSPGRLWTKKVKLC